MFELTRPDGIGMAALGSAWTATGINGSLTGLDWEFWLQMVIVVIGSVVSFLRKKKK